MGIGKTEPLAQIVIPLRTVDRRYDLVVVLAPRCDILNEILWKLPLSSPRRAGASPRTRCGDLDARWAAYETAGRGLLARDEPGRLYPRRAGGPWPGQYGQDRLQGIGLIFRHLRPHGH